MSLEIAKATKPFQIVPSTLSEVITFAKIIAGSDLVPKEYKNNYANCLVAIQMGAEVNLSPMQALQNISVINGRPCVWGDALLALVRAAPNFHSIEEWSEGSLEKGDYVALCKVQNKQGEIVERKFGMKEAKRAGLINKSGPWQQYPERMYQMRARGFACRDLFPHILRGLCSAEEIIDLPEQDFKVISVRHPKKDSQLVAEPILVENREESESTSWANFEEIKYIMETAENLDDLEVGANLAKNLKEGNKTEIRDLYKKRRNELKEKESAQ